nr:MAG TPA: hypothetical protein [Caudoviricetes sp.]
MRDTPFPLSQIFSDRVFFIYKSSEDHLSDMYLPMYLIDLSFLFSISPIIYFKL